MPRDTPPAAAWQSEVQLYGAERTYAFGGFYLIATAAAVAWPILCAVLRVERPTPLDLLAVSSRMRGGDQNRNDRECDGDRSKVC